MNEDYNDSMVQENNNEQQVESGLSLDIAVVDNSISTSAQVNGRTKLAIMLISLGDLFKRIGRSSADSVFRFATLVFNTEVKTLLTSNGNKIFTSSEGLEVLKNNPITPSGGTDIAKALRKAHELSQEFFQSTGQIGRVSVFLMTDGQSNEGAAKQAAIELKAGINSPVLATISYGLDANDRLLKEIASEVSDEQRRVLRKAGLLNLIEDNKLFVKAHDDQGNCTDEKIELVRNFSLVISQTIAKD